jgi:hypothetical protein
MIWWLSLFCGGGGMQDVYYRPSAVKVKRENGVQQSEESNCHNVLGNGQAFGWILTIILTLPKESRQSGESRALGAHNNECFPWSWYQVNQCPAHLYSFYYEF